MTHLIHILTPIHLYSYTQILIMNLTDIMINSIQGLLLRPHLLRPDLKSMMEPNLPQLIVGAMSSNVTASEDSWREFIVLRLCDALDEFGESVHGYES